MGAIAIQKYINVGVLARVRDFIAGYHFFQEIGKN